MCLGLEPRAAGKKAQTNSLSYCDIPSKAQFWTLQTLSLLWGRECCQKVSVSPITKTILVWISLTTTFCENHKNKMIKVTKQDARVRPYKENFQRKFTLGWFGVLRLVANSEQAFRLLRMERSINLRWKILHWLGHWFGLFFSLRTFLFPHWTTSFSFSICLSLLFTFALKTEQWSRRKNYHNI